MVFEFMSPLAEEWGPASKGALLAWLSFYGLFLIYAIARGGTFLFTDMLSLPIHEGGHLLFGWFGQTIGVAGGTILQLGVPLALVIYFAFRREVLGVAFTAFLFFENFLNVGTYMQDARRHDLTLVSVGGSDEVIHDWTFLFSKLGVLPYDTAIGGAVRFLGWLGMSAVMFWLWWRTGRGRLHSAD
jgi:hypothetical protein